MPQFAAKRAGAPVCVEGLAEILAAQSFEGLMEPDDMAASYLFLASDAAANITGQALNTDRGELFA